MLKAIIAFGETYWKTKKKPEKLKNLPASKKKSPYQFEDDDDPHLFGIPLQPEKGIAGDVVAHKID